MEPAPRRQRRQFLRGLALLEVLLGSLTALAPLSVDMYLPALPEIGREFEVSAAATQQSLSAFFAGFALGQFASGPVIERFGRARPLRVALVLYMLASLGCAFAASNEAMVGFRFLQALSGATVVVVPRAIVRDLTSGRASAQMMSRLILITGVAPIIGPFVGGQILRTLGWRAIFLVLAVCAAFALVASLLTLRETQRRRTAPATFAAQLAALFRERDFVAYSLCGGLAASGMFAYITGSPEVFIEQHHVSPAQFGWFFGANAVGLIGASQVNRALLRRFAPGQILAWSTVMACASGLALLAAAWTGVGGLWSLAGALFLYMSSLGVLAPNTAALALERHGERAGIASGVLGSLQFVLAAAASWLLSALVDGTAVPMAAILAGAAALSAGIFVAHGRSARAG